MKKKLLFISCCVAPLILLTGCAYGMTKAAVVITNEVIEEKNPATAYYRSKELSLKNAEKHESEADKMFDYLRSFSKGENVYDGMKKYGTKFFLTLVQEDCAACDDRYGAFKTLEENWNKGSFAGLDGSFKMYTIFVDTTNSEGENLFMDVYERTAVTLMFEETISYMSGEYADHPYFNNGDSSYLANLENLINPEEISTPTTFLIDLTENAPDWTSSYGVREVLFSFRGTNGTDDYSKARTLRDAWTNVESKDNIFSSSYSK